VWGTVSSKTSVFGEKAKLLPDVERYTMCGWHTDPDVAVRVELMGMLATPQRESITVMMPDEIRAQTDEDIDGRVATVGDACGLCVFADYRKAEQRVVLVHELPVAVLGVAEPLPLKWVIREVVAFVCWPVAPLLELAGVVFVERSGPEHVLRRAAV